MDFWIWVLVLAIVWLFEELVKAGKKKKRLPPAAPRPGVERAPARRPPPLRRAPPPRPLPPPPEPQGDVEAEDELVFEVPVLRAPRAPRRREPEPVESFEGVSAEVERPAPPPEATEAQHRRATQKYGPTTRAEVTAGRARRWLALGHGTIRDAIVWAEILGRPKGGW